MMVIGPAEETTVAAAAAAAATAITTVSTTLRTINADDVQSMYSALHDSQYSTSQSTRNLVCSVQGTLNDENSYKIRPHKRNDPSVRPQNRE